MKTRRKDVPEIFKWRHFEPEIILLCLKKQWDIFISTSLETGRWRENPDMDTK